MSRSSTEMLLIVLGVVAAIASIGIWFNHLVAYLAVIVLCIVLTVREGRKPPGSGEDYYE
jgi:hypothetical protein